MLSGGIERTRGMKWVNIYNLATNISEANLKKKSKNIVSHCLAFF